MNAVVRENLFLNCFEECIWCDITISNDSTLVGIFYRCQSSNKLRDEALFELICKASSCSKKLLLMGDFNFPELNWKIPESLEDSHPFLKCINDNFLIQHVEL